MADRVFDVELTITKTVRVKVPDYMKDHPPHSTDEEAAEEFAIGGKALWDEFVLSEDEDIDVESVTEVTPATA